MAVIIRMHWSEGRCFSVLNEILERCLYRPWLVFYVAVGARDSRRHGAVMVSFRRWMIPCSLDHMGSLSVVNLWALSRKQRGWRLHAPSAPRAVDSRELSLTPWIQIRKRPLFQRVKHSSSKERKTVKATERERERLKHSFIPSLFCSVTATKQYPPIIYYNLIIHLKSRLVLLKRHFHPP